MNNMENYLSSLTIKQVNQAIQAEKNKTNNETKVTDNAEKTAF